MNNNLADFWENKVPKADKHFVDQLSDEKINRMLNRVRNNLLSHINLEEINTTLDWGCGGGLFARELKNFSDIVLIDISPESLRRAQNEIGNFKHAQVVPECITMFKYNGPPVDLLFCHTVIHHFPSYDYWKAVLDIWMNQISPKYFAVQIKVGEKTVWHEDVDLYYHDKNYLNGLFFAEKEFVNDFSNYNYSMVSSKIEINKYFNPDREMKVGYYVFRKDNV